MKKGIIAKHENGRSGTTSEAAPKGDCVWGGDVSSSLILGMCAKWGEV